MANGVLFQAVFGVLVALAFLSPAENASANQQQVYNACLAACVATDRGSAQDRAERCEAQCAALKPDN